ncbi:hypothetical protein HF086_005504 [Spodoptera exigua]|uniref:RNA-directed DNA polymerase n=1 Tax=Spodoptera exigua TaxID=7107 RepID=A0A922SHF4_SPOEX|nr:hypothetical protein HF086_005504 [Spodoptera exigua]
MDLPVLQDLLKAIKDAVSGTRRRDDDVALPIFDPTTSDLGAESWCNNIETLSKEFGWSSVATVAKAGKALKGSALLWFETWDPVEGRSWENLRTELTALYPEKRNLAEKLQKAILYTSESSDSYCEYAREKLRLLRNTKIAFTESQLIDLVCGNITDVNVKMASFNSNVKTTSELIALFTSYAKIRKRPSESTNKDSSTYPKRPRIETRSNDVKLPKRRPPIPEVNLIEVSDNNSSQSWLKIAQQNDPETRTLISQLEAGDLDNNQYLIKNDLLHYKTDPDTEPKLFVPKGYRLSLLKLFHDENCHVGFDKVLHKIREYFWFPGMATFIKKYISHCLICTERKGCSGPKQGLLHPIDKAAIPFHTLHLDCTGPFTTTSEGYRHVLLLVDGFTKFCLLKPLKTLSTHELIPIIREIVTLFGTPSVVITDRGTNFSSNQIRNMFRELHIEHHMIATGTPRSNGQVERYVATIINMLSTTCNDLSDWPNGLWKVQQSINTTIQKSTGFSPLRLLIGVEANIPIVQARLNDVLDDENRQLNIDVQADRELARQRLQLVSEKFKSRFDSVRRNNKNYSIGDLVYVSQDHRRNDKLAPKFKGPYEISSNLPNDRYALKGLGNLRDISVAKEKLRFWPGEWVDENIAVESAI